MDKQAPPELMIESLSVGIPVIPQGAEGFFIQSCTVCLDYHGHRSRTPFFVNYSKKNHSYLLVWETVVTDQHRRAFADIQETTEYSATAIAFLLIRELTEFTTIERAKKGTNIDYFLSSKSDTDKLIFNHTSRLEISGILKESENNSVDKRISTKINRLKQFDDDQSTYIIVVEHSRPWAKMIKYDG